ARLLAAMGDIGSFEIKADDSAWFVAALICGSLDLDAVCEDVYAQERAGRQLRRMVARSLEHGDPLKSMRELVDDMAADVTPECLAELEALIADATKASSEARPADGTRPTDG